MIRYYCPILRRVALSHTILLLCVGCGGPQYELGDVTGRITLDGEPLPNASVRFQPISEDGLGGRPAMATTDSNGYYRLQYTDTAQGASLGRHLVRISTGQEGYDDGEYHPPIPEKVPVQYNRDAPDNPEMSVEVKPGSNEFNFDLKSHGEMIQPDDGKAPNS